MDAEQASGALDRGAAVPRHTLGTEASHRPPLTKGPQNSLADTQGLYGAECVAGLSLSDPGPAEPSRASTPTAASARLRAASRARRRAVHSRTRRGLWRLRRGAPHRRSRALSSVRRRGLCPVPAATGHKTLWGAVGGLSPSSPGLRAPSRSPATPLDEEGPEEGPSAMHLLRDQGHAPPRRVRPARRSPSPSSPVRGRPCGARARACRGPAETLPAGKEAAAQAALHGRRGPEARPGRRRGAATRGGTATTGHGDSGPGLALAGQVGEAGPDRRGISRASREHACGREAEPGHRSAWRRTGPRLPLHGTSPV